MKKKLSTIVLMLIFIIGFLILMYPTFSNYYNKMVGSYSIGKYDGEVSKTNEIDIQQIYTNAQQYNQELLDNPTGIKRGESKDPNYLSQLKIKDNESIIGSVTIDKINVKLPIYHGTSEPVLQAGVGHLEGTTLPIGGIGTHSVLTGHSGLPSAKLFTDLEKLTEGDIISIGVLGQTLYYKVIGTQVVLPKEVESLRTDSNRDLVTLVTCTPYGVNSHRLLIHAERTEYVEDIEPVVLGESTNNKLPVILVVSALSVLMIVFIIKRKKQKQ